MSPAGWGRDLRLGLRFAFSGGREGWLRVTLMFRRDGSGWAAVHRHADPLVHPISHDVLGALARGDATGQSTSC